MARSAPTVVVGYDGSEAAQRALVRAIAAAEPDGRVVVVTASAPAGELLSGQELPESEQLEPERLLDEAAALCRGHDVDVVRRLEHAEPADALSGAARDLDAGLIVVGARGHSFVARALRGSVGEKLVARAPCDVLVVR